MSRLYRTVALETHESVVWWLSSDVFKHVLHISCTTRIYFNSSMARSKEPWVEMDVSFKNSAFTCANYRLCSFGEASWQGIILTDPPARVADVLLQFVGGGGAFKIEIRDDENGQALEKITAGEILEDVQHMIKKRDAPPSATFTLKFHIPSQMASYEALVRAGVLKPNAKQVTQTAGWDIPDFLDKKLP